MRRITTSDDCIIIEDLNGDPLTVAEFEGIDRIQGSIEETELMVLSPSDLIELATWLLKRAAGRSQEAENRD